MPPAPAEDHALAVERALRVIDAAVDAGERPPALDALAREAGFSASQLRRLFVGRVGTTPREYADARRAARLRAALANGSPVADAVHGAGFGGPSRVYERSGPLLGMTPAAYRRGAPGELIRYALADTSLGRVVVASTPRGVCLIAFAAEEAPDPDASLAAEVARRFPRAEVARADEAHAAWVETVVALADDPSSADGLPLDVRGTAFQQRVWRSLAEVPSGETVSYADLARLIGRPSATRAVAQACGANPLALAIPCHRVVGSDGSLTGYRWGVPRKRALLEREARRSRTSASVRSGKRR